MFCIGLNILTWYPFWLQVLLFDSVIMVGNTDTMNEDGTLTTAKLSSPSVRARNASLAQEQLDWLVGRMETSTADYLWVGGHYPVWAIGQDPPTGVRQILRDKLNKWEANYFNGHEHDFEHIKEEGTKVNYISTGAGMSCCYADKNLGTVPQNSIKFASSGSGGAEWWGGVPIPDFTILSGFTSYRVGADSMKVYYHAHNGTVLYSKPRIITSPLLFEMAPKNPYKIDSRCVLLPFHLRLIFCRYVTDAILPRTKQAQAPPPPIAPFCTDTTCPHKTRTAAAPPHVTQH